MQKVPPSPEVYACLEEVAARFKTMPYDELERTAEKYGACGDELIEEVDFLDKSYTVVVQFGRLGFPLGRRIGVEIVLWGESSENWSQTVSTYFERHASGRIRDFFLPTTWRTYLTWEVCTCTIMIAAGIVFGIVAGC